MKFLRTTVLKNLFKAVDFKVQSQFGFKIKDATYTKLVDYMHQPKDASSLAVTRILFGLTMLLDIPDERGGAIMETRWDANICHFPLLPFIQPICMPYMAIVYAGLWIGACGIMFGYKYRATSVLFTVCYWYLFLIEKSYWNNHSYLFGLVAFLLSRTDANCFWSLDAFLNPSKQKNTVPYWNYFILKYQFFILYFMAGMKKGTAEWLTGYSVQNLSEHWVFTPFKIFMTVPQTDYLIVHWFVFVFDLTVAGWMMYAPTRHFAMLLCATFHLMNIRLFRIGMFPWVCLATLPLFYPFDWPKLTLKYLKERKRNLRTFICRMTMKECGCESTDDDYNDETTESTVTDNDDEYLDEVFGSTESNKTINSEHHSIKANDCIDTEDKQDETDSTTKCNEDIQDKIDSTTKCNEDKQDENDSTKKCNENKQDETDTTTKCNEDKQDKTDSTTKCNEDKQDQIDSTKKGYEEKIATENLRNSKRNLELILDEKDTKDKNKGKVTVFLILLYVFLQAFLPYSHFITKGYNNWTNGLYGYSWDMMVHTWDTYSVTLKIIDNTNQRIEYINPFVYSPNDRWTRHGDMVYQYAKCIKNKILTGDTTKNVLSANISIFVDVWCSMNGRFTQRMFDSKVDLLKADWSPFKKIEFLMPLLDESIGWRERLDEIRKHVNSWNNFSDVIFLADFPGYTYEKYIPYELRNVTLTVLDGTVAYQPEATLQTGHSYKLKNGDQTPVATDMFHNITNIGNKPALYMYTYYNISGNNISNYYKEMKPILPILHELYARYLKMILFFMNIAKSFNDILLNVFNKIF